MKRVLPALMLLAAAALAPATGAHASIHPLVASFCGTVAGTNPNVLDPPGQTPTSNNPNDWKVSNLRALQATGFLTLIRDASGAVIGFTVDPTIPAVKDYGFPAFVNCRNLNP